VEILFDVITLACIISFCGALIQIISSVMNGLKQYTVTTGAIMCIATLVFGVISLGLGIHSSTAELTSTDAAAILDIVAVMLSLVSVFSGIAACFVAA
jgi:hypothetical protein